MPQWFKPFYRWFVFPVHSYRYSRDCNGSRRRSIWFAFDMSASSQWGANPLDGIADVIRRRKT